jgi:hypothetical protein
VRLSTAGLTNYYMSDDVMTGKTHHDRIQNWLRVAGAEKRSPQARVRQLAYVMSEAVRGRRAPLRSALSILAR